MRGIPVFLKFDNFKNLGSISIKNMILKTGKRGFINCESLVNVDYFSIEDSLYLNDLFKNYKSLRSIPELDTSETEGMSGMYCYCTSLKTPPKFKPGVNAYKAYIPGQGLFDINSVNVESAIEQIRKVKENKYEEIIDKAIK